MMYSALSSRLLLPPMTRPLPPTTLPAASKMSGSFGPMVRMSNPRRLKLSPHRQQLEDRQPLGGSQRRDVLATRPHPERQTRGVAQEPHPLERRLVEMRVAAQTGGQLERRRVPAAGHRKDRMIHRVVHEGRRDRADRPRPARAEQEGVLQERIELQEPGIQKRGVDLLDVGLLERVPQEELRPAPGPHPQRRGRPDRALGELIDEPDVAAEHVEPGGDRLAEEIRLGEPEDIVLDALAVLERHRERLAATQEVGGLKRQLQEEAVELRGAGAERELVEVGLLELERQVDLVLDPGGASRSGWRCPRRGARSTRAD